MRISFLLFILYFVFNSYSIGGEIYFSGYKWIVSERVGGPANNVFVSSNVEDRKGKLCLFSRGGASSPVTSSEIRTSEPLSYGVYILELDSLPYFDENLVFGFFNYPSKNIGPDGTNEIDIEISQWGSKLRPRGNFGLFTADVSKKNRPLVNRFDLPEIGGVVYLMFVWDAFGISYLILDDHKIYMQWRVEETSDGIIPKNPQSLFVNFWAVKSQKKSSPAMVCINRFYYYGFGD